MSYDIGIGLCAGIEGANVVVKLDSAVVSKLIPKQPWRKSGTSLLQFKSDLCSARRPPEVGSEVYLDSAALTKNAPVGKLTISRPKQLTIEGWSRPVKVKK